MHTITLKEFRQILRKQKGRTPRRKRNESIKKYVLRNRPIARKSLGSRFFRVKINDKRRIE